MHKSRHHSLLFRSYATSNRRVKERNVNDFLIESIEIDWQFYRQLKDIYINHIIICIHFQNEDDSHSCYSSAALSVLQKILSILFSHFHPATFYSRRQGISLNLQIAKSEINKILRTNECERVILPRKSYTRSFSHTIGSISSFIIVLIVIRLSNGRSYCILLN